MAQQSQVDQIVIEELEIDRILKKQKSSLGGVKYLVSYKDSEQQTWETEQHLRDKHSELIEDFNYFTVTGERYDQATLKNKRQNEALIQSFEAPRKIRPSVELPKRDKIVQKVIDKRDQAEIKQPIIQQTAIVKLNEGLSQMSLQQTASEHDKIRTLEYTQDNQFRVTYQSREDGSVPLQEYYHYHQLRTLAPYLLIQFYEQQWCQIQSKQLILQTNAPPDVNRMIHQSLQNQPQYQTMRTNESQANKHQNIQLEYQKALENAYE